MVTVITASGSPIILPLAREARVENGRLLCLDAGGERVLSFDPLDVTAYAVEREGQEPVWVMGGLDLLQLEQDESPGDRPQWRLAARLHLI